MNENKLQELKTPLEQKNDSLKSTSTLSNLTTTDESYNPSLQKSEYTFVNLPRTQGETTVNLGAKNYAMWGGMAMILFAAISFLVPGRINGLPQLRLEDSYGMFLGYFPMNILNKLALVSFGIAGFFSAARLSSSLIWCRAVFVVMGFAAVLGLIPQTYTLFGYWPLFGAEVFAHGLFALLAIYFATVSMPNRNKIDKSIRKDGIRL